MEIGKKRTSERQITYVKGRKREKERREDKERKGEEWVKEKTKERTKESAVLSTASRGLQESEIDVNIRSLLNKTRETKSHRKTPV